MDVIQALIQKKCNQTVYVHFCAHWLNLVLVDVVKQIPIGLFSWPQSLCIVQLYLKPDDIRLYSNYRTWPSLEFVLKSDVC